MKNLLFCLAVTILVISLVFCASSVTAVTCDYNITQCGTISESGNWCMNQNIYNDTASVKCILIEASDVVLDGLGNTLKTSIENPLSIVGIRISGLNNVTIRNINMSQWFYAIDVDKNNTNITNNTIWNVTQAVHLLTSGPGNIYGHNASVTYNNIINASDTGIYIQNSNNNNISHNVINSEGGGQYGLRVYNSRNNFIQANNLTTIDFTMTFSSSDYNYIDSNIIDRSNLGGFLLINSSHNNLSNNYIYQPNQSAFEACCGSNYNIFLRNNVTDAKNHGFKINDSVGNNLTSNIVRNVNTTGFYLMNLSNSTIVLNRIINLSQSGLQIMNSTGINITNNTFENPSANQNGSYGFEIFNVNSSIISYNNMSNLTYKGFIINRSNNNSFVENNYTTLFISSTFIFLRLDRSNSNDINGVYFTSTFGITAASACGPLFSFSNSSLNNLSNVIAEAILHSNRGIVFLADSNNNTLKNLTFANDECATFDFSRASYNKILDSISNLYVNYSGYNNSNQISFVSNHTSLSNEIRFLRMRFYGQLNSTVINISAYGSNFALSPTKYPINAPGNISKFFNFTKTVLGGIYENVSLNVTYDESELGYALEPTLTMNYSQIGGGGGIGEWSPIQYQGVNLEDNYVWAKIGTLLDPLATTYFGLFADHDNPPEITLTMPPYRGPLESDQFNFTAVDDYASTMNCSIYIDGIYNQSNASTKNNTLTTFTIPGITNGEHTWNVSCNDGSNDGWSQTWIFTVGVNPNPCEATPVTLDQTNKTYTMNQSVSAEGTCYIIGAENVTLDCANYIINYSNSIAGSAIINNESYNHTIIRNCIIKQTSSGLSSSSAIYFEDYAHGHKLENNTIQTLSDDSHGIQISQLSNSTINLTTITTIGLTSNAINLETLDTQINIINNTLVSSGAGSKCFSLTSDSTNNNVSYNNFNSCNTSIIIAGSNTRNEFISNNFSNTFVSFNNYSGSFEIRNVLTAPGDYGSYKNISKYINVTNTSSAAWIILNFSYLDSDWQNAGITDESTLSIWHYNTTWYNLTSTLNIINNFIYTNASSFSIFAPRGTGLDSSAPVASFGQNPVDTSTDTDGDITFDFKCFDDVGVSMIQLWTNTTGTWKANYSNSSYTNNTWLNITLTGISDALNYKWAVWCNDTSALTDMTQNRTFTVDKTDPTALQGQNPIDNYNDTDNSITFDMKCSDNIAVSTIILYTNMTGTWQADYTNSSYTNDTWLNWTMGSIQNGENIKWYVWCNDTADLTNTTLNRTFNVDSSSPIPVQGQNPIEGYNDSDGNITFDFKCSDNFGVSMIQLWSNWSGTWRANYSNSSYTNNTWLNITVLGIPQAQNYKWAVYCNDTYSNSAITENRTFSVDKTSPVAVLGINPVNHYNYSNISGSGTPGNKINFDIKCYDNVAVSTIQLWTNTTGTWHANYTNSSYTNNTLLTIQVTGIPEAMNYKWAVWCNDSVGFSNITQNRTFNVDTILPTIIIDYPQNNTYFKYAPYINGSCTDAVSGVYSIWTNATEYPTLDLTSPFNFTNTSNLTNKAYLLQIRCNDSLNNTATSLVNFTYDTINPLITFISPTPNNGTQPSRKVIINVSLGDTNPSMTWLNWNGIPEQNQSWTTGPLTFEKHNLFNGNYTYNVTVYDLAGNSNLSETRWIYINSTTPVVELLYPTNNNYSNLTWTNFTCNLTADTGRTMKNVTFYWNYTGVWLANGSNTTLDKKNEIVAFNRSLENKSVMWNCLAYDNESEGEWSTQNYTFTSDRVNPIAVQGANPIDNYNSSSSSLVFDIKCTDNFGLSTMQLWTNTTGTWHANYTNSNYTNNTWFNLTVAEIPDATNYKWAVYCSDKAGNSNITQNKTFNVDITPPETYFGIKTVNGTITNSRSITFDLKCTDNQNVFAIALYGDWNNIWSIKNLTLSPGNDTWVNYNYTLNPSEADRAYHWNVFCNDSMSNSAFNSTNRTIILDTNPPVVSLNTPANGNHTNSTRVTFACSATDTNLSNITLYGNFTGTWQLNETKTASGSSSSATFAKILEANSDYIWNCESCDGLGQCNYSSQNYTLSIDTGYPKLSLISPDDNHDFAYDVSSITFQWSISDNYVPTIDCTIYTKNRYQTTKNCNNATTCEQTISGFSEGTSTWRVNCSDGINQNISGTRSFTIAHPPEGEGGGGGGGGGGAGYCGDNFCNRSLGTYVFNCSAYGYSQLYNISLYGSWGPGWHIDELRNINGQDINVSFKRIANASGTYVWNCYVCGRLPSGYLKCSFIMKNQTAIITTTGGGEDTGNCCRDCGCPSGQDCLDNSCSIIESCGNGICDPIESYSNCCTDCACPSGEICTASGCTSQSYCGDHVCDASIGETLDNCPLDCVYVPLNCGDNYCDRTTENVATCPQDCKAVCGNRICEDTEDQSACCKDCGCPEGQDCSNNKCSKKAGVDLSGFWRIIKTGFLPLIIIIIAALIALGTYLFIKKYKQKSLIQIMMNIGKEIDKKKFNEVQARIRREQADFSTQNKKIRANINIGLNICKDILKESIEKGEIAAVAELAETKKDLLKRITVLFEKYIDIIKKERSPFEHNLKLIMFSEEIPLYENLKKTISHLYNVGRKIRLEKSPLKIGG